MSWPHEAAKYQTKLRAFELDVLCNTPAVLAEYEQKVLPMFFMLVDQSREYNCSDIAKEIAVAARRHPFKTMWVGIARTGWSMDRRNGAQWAHAAAIVFQNGTNRPLMLLDPIKMQPMGGQSNTEPGAYYRWPPSVWSPIKSAHYGKAGISEWYATTACFDAKSPKGVRF